MGAGVCLSLESTLTQGTCNQYSPGKKGESCRQRIVTPQLRQRAKWEAMEGVGGWRVLPIHLCPLSSFCCPKWALTRQKRAVVLGQVTTESWVESFPCGVCKCQCGKQDKPLFSCLDSNNLQRLSYCCGGGKLNALPCILSWVDGGWLGAPPQPHLNL